jgi:hypothetical protein
MRRNLRNVYTNPKEEEEDLMLFTPRFRGVVLGIAYLFGAAVYGAVIHDENTDGDLSNSGLTPTFLTVSLGSNQVLGVTGSRPDVDRDYFTITVPAGAFITSIILLPGTVSLGPEGESFIGIQKGPQVTVPVFPADATGLLGWMHYEADDVGTNILPAMGTSDFGADGFKPPLPSGKYSFWVQDLDNGTAPYGLDINIATPEPGSAAMVLTALGLIAGRVVRRRRRSS